MSDADMAAATDVLKAGDHWVLPVVDQPVHQLSFDFSVTLRLGNEVVVRIEGPFVMSDGDAEHSMDPGGEPNLLAPVLGISRATITSGLAFEDGHLEMTLARGARLSVAPSDDYEPWEIVGPRGMRIVSIPGGELSIWRSRA